MNKESNRENKNANAKKEQEQIDMKDQYNKDIKGQEGSRTETQTYTKTKETDKGKEKQDSQSLFNDSKDNKGGKVEEEVNITSEDYYETPNLANQEKEEDFKEKRYQGSQQQNQQTDKNLNIGQK